MRQQFKTIEKYFDEVLESLPCEHATKAYIVSIYTKYRGVEHDLSKDSLTLLYAQAKEKQDFISFQDIGDWIFFANTITPNHLNNASPEYYHTLARVSYYSCYRLIRREWKLFEELSDNFVTLESEAKKLLNFNNVNWVGIKT